LGRELEDVQCVSGIAAGPPRDQLDDPVRGFGAELVRAAPHDQRQLPLGQRLQFVDLRAREEGRVDLEVRVLGRRADQRQRPLLDRRQERVLLRLVEAVDLVEEEDRPPPMRAEALPRGRDHLAHLGDRRGDG
jgi:hypothetical protein